MKFNYYTFRRVYSREPLDLVDLFDGLAVHRATSELEALAWQRNSEGGFGRG
jgi:hypothetical protein